MSDSGFGLGGSTPGAGEVQGLPWDPVRVHRVTSRTVGFEFEFEFESRVLFECQESGVFRPRTSGSRRVRSGFRLRRD